MSTDPTWFQKQLDIASERADQLPDWAKKQAGVPTFEVDDKAMLDWLEKRSCHGTEIACFQGRHGNEVMVVTETGWDGEGDDARHFGRTVRDAIRAAMKAEVLSTTSRPGIHAVLLCPQCKQHVITPHRCDKDGSGEYLVEFVRAPVVRRPPVFLDPRDFEDEEADR